MRSTPSCSKRSAMFRIGSPGYNLELYNLHKNILYYLLSLILRRTISHQRRAFSDDIHSEFVFANEKSKFEIAPLHPWFYESHKTVRQK